MTNLYKKLKTYGVYRTLIYTFMELEYLLRRYMYGSFSQRGEDLVLARQFPSDYKGFYVDVGANNPFRFSNTCHFYNKGWRGINIEPDVSNHSQFIKHRPSDCNLNIGVGEKEGVLSYYRFDPHTLNTFSKEESDSYVQQGYELLETLQVPVERLDRVLERELPEGTSIDFMSVDTEGYDISVLKSAALEKYEPKYICVESVKHNIDGGDGIGELHNILVQSGYEELHNTGINTIYRRV